MNEYIITINMKGKKIQEEGLVTSIVKKTAGKNKDYSKYSKERLIAELNKLKKTKEIWTCLGI